MNTERLHRILQQVRHELTSAQVLKYLQSLATALASQATQPQQPGHQQQVANILKLLRDRLPQAPSNQFSPLWQQSLDELGVTPLLGHHLLKQIEDILGKNTITPTVAAQELNALATALGQVQGAIDNIAQGFAHFQIGTEELKPGECQFGLQIPRAAFQEQFELLLAKLHEVQFVIRCFSETVLGHPSPVVVRTISSSDPSFVLDVVPPVAAFLALAIERVVALYKNLLEIRKLRAELHDRSVPVKALAGIDRHANAVMTAGIEAFLEEYFDKRCQVKDAGRRNEMRLALGIALNKIANRVDRGFNFEVRALAPEAAKKDSGGERVAELISEIERVSGSMEFIRPEGASILQLPEQASTATQTTARE